MPKRETHNFISDREEAVELSVRAGNAFQPRAPISTRELFAGRWEQITTVADAVFQAGLHIIIFGERGVGKTSLANIIKPLLKVMEDDLSRKTSEPRLVVKVNVHDGDSFGKVWNRVFEEVSFVEDQPVIGIAARPESRRITLKEALKVSDDPSIDQVRRVVSGITRSVFIFDEFDRGSAGLRASFTDLIKALSDYAVDCTIVIVGVSDTVDDLIRDHASIVRAVVQVHLPRMNISELTEILTKGSQTLGITFEPDASQLIVRMSQGLPHYTHLIGLHSARSSVNRLSRVVTVKDVHDSLTKAVEQASQSTREKYLTATHSAHRGALYDEVILACAAVSSSVKDALGYFYASDLVAPMSFILNRTSVPIAAFQRHIHEFCENGRGHILERTGQKRSYKYRFRDPLMPPYIFMKAAAEGQIDIVRLTKITSGD
jgi:hypothetical protein